MTKARLILPPPPVKITDLLIYTRKTESSEHFLLHACNPEQKMPTATFQHMFFARWKKSFPHSFSLLL